MNLINSTGGKYSGPKTGKCCKTAKKYGYRKKAFSEFGLRRMRTEGLIRAAVCQWCKPRKMLNSIYNIVYLYLKKHYTILLLLLFVAGNDQAIMNMNIKPQPGEFPSSEEIDKPMNQQDPGM